MRFVECSVPQFQELFMYNILFDLKNDLLSAIISICLWSRPHQLDTIIEKLEKIFPVDDESRDEFIRCTNIVLDEACNAGFIKKDSDFYMLTEKGRKKSESRAAFCL
jgi:hypothetical protein